MKNPLAPQGKGMFILAVMLLALALSFSTAGAADGYLQTNLVSDDSPDSKAKFMANNTDPNLINPWGISYGPGTPFWVSDNGTGKATLYNGAGQPFPVGSPLMVNIPPAGAGTPTGQAFNTANGSGAFNRDLFLFASEDGTLSGWRGALGTTAEVLQLSSPDNVYKGLAMATIVTNSYLYAANFRAGTIDVLKGNAGAPDLTGRFTDPNLPAGYAPFNIQNINGNLFVTFAKQDAAKHDDVAGPGNGFVDKFDLNGNLITRLITNGPLNSPWGLALAPEKFGKFSKDLLVGNFGDGKINAFDPSSGAFLGNLKDVNGNDIIIDGLWGLIVGNGGNGGDLDKLYFSSGPNDEMAGLFGSLAPAPLPGSLVLLGSGILALGIGRRRLFK